MYLNRVKQAVELTADPDPNMVFGAAVPGYRAVTLSPPWGTGAFSYYISNADGSVFEVGQYYAYYDSFSGSVLSGRVCDISSDGEYTPLTAGTQGLTLTVVGGDVNSVATSRGSPGPSALAIQSLAVGPGAIAAHQYSGAFGMFVETRVHGEYAFGHDGHPRRSHVSGQVYVSPESVDLLQSPGSDEQIVFDAGVLPGKGVLRITGHVLVTNGDTEDPADTQVFEVSVLKYVIGPSGSLHGWWNGTAPTFTPLISPSDSTMTDVVLDMDYGGLRVTNNSTTRGVIVSALLVVDYLDVQDWW